MIDLNVYIKETANTVNERLDEICSHFHDISVSKAMEYSLKNGGKRIRPFLAVEFSKACGGNTNAAVDFACAVEMVHTYSLIHDDLPSMDNDDVRRGKPSCHKAFGEATALLAGDGLLTEAFAVLATAKGVPAENRVSAVRELSTNAGINGMIKGQTLDLQFENTRPTPTDILEMYALKTGNLLRASCCLGCLTLDGCTDNLLNAANEYALNLGIAFQIMDDILDVTSDAATLGKPVGSDDKNDKSTIVKFFGLEKAKSLVGDYTEKAVDALKMIDGDTSILKEFALYMANRTY